MPLTYNSKFQFQTGSIRSEKPEGFDFVEDGFNSKLVRLEVTTSSMKTHILNVSIPNWFD